jgi:hypothetical protein
LDFFPAADVSVAGISAPFSSGAATSFKTSSSTSSIRSAIADFSARPNPSKIRALEFKGEFRRFGIYSVSATIDNDRYVFDLRRPEPLSA